MRRRLCSNASALVTGLLTVVLVTSCAADGGDNADSTANPGDTITVTDSAGRSLTLSQPVERVAILDTGTATVMRALGVLDRLVGSHDALVGDPLWAEIADVPAVATHSETSFEALAAVRPELVFSSIRAHGVVTDNDLLNNFDIADFKISLRRPDLMKHEITTMGEIFQVPSKARELVDFYTETEQEITARIADVPDDQRPTVFVEYHAGDFNTGGPQSRFYEQITLAGGRNIAADVDDEVQVSAEWVAEQNPDMIIREGAKLGYGVTSTGDAEQLRTEVMSRPGLDTTSAVKNGDVYVLPTDAYSRPGYIVGVAHIAQWLYPDRFDDAFVKQVEDDFTRLFYPGVEEGAIWAYPTAGQADR